MPVPDRREAQAERKEEQARGRIRRRRKPDVDREPGGPQAGGSWQPQEARAARPEQNSGGTSLRPIAGGLG
jgi:hypothetical protein